MLIAFSKSPIWQLQRQYFSEANVGAWSTGDVPHYITSNPRMAQTYANIILAFLRDVTEQFKNINEPVYIIELGTGSGRFSFHLLSALTRLNSVNSFKFKYVMTDFVPATIEFWETHPCLQTFFDEKILDIALFDAEKNDCMFLKKENKYLESSPLPIIVIANYFFDSIPQELFHVKNGEINQVFTELDESSLKYNSAREAIEKLKINYHYEEAKTDFFEDKQLNEILETYGHLINNSHILFPSIGINCINNLSKMSEAGLMLLTADKGEHRLEEFDYCSAPQIVKHGSFSLASNYHAIKIHCELNKGKALFPKQLYDYINVGCLIYISNNEDYRNTKLAYTNELEFFGPDDYFNIKKHIEKQTNQLSVSNLCAYLRLSNYDAHLFYQFIPRFYELITEFTNNERFTFLQTVAKIWNCYYPIKEEEDLAFAIATLLFNLMFYNEALKFFELSKQIYGDKEQTTFNIALCYVELHETKAAENLLKNNHGHKQSQDLLRRIESSKLVKNKR